MAKIELIPTRATLLARLKDWKDDSSWQEFFAVYSKLIYGVALKNKLTEAEAEDVVQETMFSVAKHISTFEYDRNVGSFKHWLLNMTRWRIRDQLRRRETLAVQLPQQTSTKTQLVNKVTDPASENLDEFWETKWEKGLLEAAIKKVKQTIDPEKYQIFDFVVNKEWPPEKVAKSFEISVGQVYLAKHRITELIRKEVKMLREKIG
jgi:RNA polymerase sigma factor (sigma-70 family)